LRIIHQAIVLIILSQPLSACRLWAVLAKPNITFPTMTSSERAIVTDQLNHLLLQSEYVQDGWSLLKYGVNDAHPIEPLFRSELSALDDAENYWSTVSMLVDEGEGFVGLGHLRATTSGMGNIPNPHPWMFYDG
ncbi:uncharacterized protein METZ01_LOCUS480583, partial [marine metagenome]